MTNRLDFDGDPDPGLYHDVDFYDFYSYYLQYLQSKINNIKNHDTSSMSSPEQGRSRDKKAITECRQCHA